MSTEKVWLRFEKKIAGSIRKLRIQDVPPERIDEVIELMATHFARDETVHKAVGITSNPVAVEGYLGYLNLTFRDPACRVAICCADEDGPQEIMGLSGVAQSKDNSAWDQLIQMTEAFLQALMNVREKLPPVRKKPRLRRASVREEHGTQESKKLLAIFYEASLLFDPIKEYNLSVYYDDRGVLVHPDYRGYGLAQPLLTVRRLMCAAHGVPMTGAWMTARGTQAAAARGGWETRAELRYDDLARRHGLTFVDAPPTMKFMVARPLEED